MKKFWKKYRAWIIIALAAVLLIVVGTLRKNSVDPHAGHDHATNPHTEQTQSGSSHEDHDHATEPTQSGDPHAGHDHSDYKAENSYTITTDSNGRHIVQVKDAHSSIIFSRNNLVEKPTCTAVDEDILCVADNSPSLGSRWAVFCNVKQGLVTEPFTGCLSVQGRYVAYGINTNNAWQVHVRDAFNTSAYNEVYTLEGAHVNDSRSVIEKAELVDGNLLVTYWAGDVEKTATIDMP